MNHIQEEDYGTAKCYIKLKYECTLVMVILNWLRVMVYTSIMPRRVYHVVTNVAMQLTLLT